MKAWVVTVALVCVAVATGSAPASHRAARCPLGALALPANPIGPAARVALAREDPSSRPQVVEAVLASGDLRGRGQQVRACGSRALSRTVVVYITLRKFLPSASLSERVSFVSRFGSGWRVWQIAH